jgi:hypothetical protein
MTLKIISIIASVFMFMTTCKKETVDDQLSLIREPFIGNNLHIGGYYYQKAGNSLVYDFSFFYSNGIFLNGGGGEKSIIQAEDYIKRLLIINKAHQGTKIGWGVFKVEGINIKFERWYPSERPYKAYVGEGKIINDTTFVITESYRMQKGAKTDIQPKNETYYFKQFSPKPDSTNEFVK